MDNLPIVEIDDMDFNIFLEATLDIFKPYLNWSKSDFERIFAKANISKRQVKTHLELMSRVSQAIKDNIVDMDEDDYVLISTDELKRLQEK